MDHEVDEQLVAAAMAVSRALVAVTARTITAGAQEVTLAQYRALVVLTEHQPRTMAEIAGVLGLSPSSCTRLVERIERKGLVRRSPSPESRRRVDLHLEPAGELLVATVMAERRRAIQELLAGLPASRVASVRRALTEVAELAGEAVEVAGPLAGHAIEA
ncbi:MAG: MarR family transcriptional regulator [Acidimicrobiales bacterium]